MGKKNLEKIRLEEKEKSRKESELRRKPSESQPGISIPGHSPPARTSRQQVLAEKRGKDKGRGIEKNVPPPQDESESDDEDVPAPPKRTKKVDSKGKGVAVEKDKSKKPTVSELYKHLRDEISWFPTRFADPAMMTKLGIETDMKTLLQNLSLESLFSMAPPTYKEISCQFLASLEATFYSDAEHLTDGWGKIKFKVNGKTHHMSFREIGEVMRFQDNAVPTLPRCRETPKMVWQLIAGAHRRAGHDKNTSIRHPAVRYLHRVLVHTLFPRKEPSTVNEDELLLMSQAILSLVHPSKLPPSCGEMFNDFGMVGFFVKRLIFYKEWAWTTSDAKPQIGIGGMITPLLLAKGVDLGGDEKGPLLIDGPYLKSAQYLKGLYQGEYVYSYLLNGKPVEVLLPNKRLTWIANPGIISFDIDQEAFLGPHGPLDPIQIPKRKRTGASYHATFEEDAPEQSSPTYGPPRYYFEQHTGSLPHGPLRDAHEYIGKLQRWNKAQDRTIFKLKNKYKEIKKSMKKQAEASAKFMKKVADILVKGGVAGCSSADFVMRETSAPQPHPSDPFSLGRLMSARQLERIRRNPIPPPSASGNNSPSLASSGEDNIQEVSTEQREFVREHGYYTTYPDSDTEAPTYPPYY